MAKRPAEDEEDDLPKVRKRRYKPPKKEEEEDAPRFAQKGREEDDDEEEESISTGNVYLDITLDFVDDCIDWSREHVLYAAIIGAVTFLVVTSLSYFFIRSWIRYFNRPTLATVIKAYDFGFYPETKLLADEALRYIPLSDPETRSAFLFLQGAALCAIAEQADPADQRDYYLLAANYLTESARYGFLPKRVADGWFFLGESLFHCGELEQCRLPLEIALDEKYPHVKKIYWYLANTYFWGVAPDSESERIQQWKRAERYLQRFQKEPTALEEEIAESRLLETMIALQIGGIHAAESVIAKVPRFNQFVAMRHCVEGQIELFTAREFRRQAIDLETDPNPSLLRNVPVAPAPVSPETPLPPLPMPPSVEIPTAPAPVSPMDESTLRDLMPPAVPLAPVLGAFDHSSEIQQRLAAMQVKYAEGMSDDEIIILPKEEATKAPEPPPLQPQDMQSAPLIRDPILRRTKELREVAASHYQQAVDHFSEVIRLSNADNPWGRTARLLTGISYAEMEAHQSANESFRNLIDTFPASPEAAAAAYFLGEYERTKGNTDAAFRLLGYAFESIRQNPNYASLWLPKTMIARQCAVKVRSDMTQQLHADAIKLLDMLGGIMSPADIAQLRGETYENWAAFLQSQADTTFGERGNQLAKDAQSKWRNAGAAFDTLAQWRADTLEHANILWRIAENYRAGRDYRRGIIAYQKYIKVDMLRRRPEVNLYLGEMYFQLDFLAEAEYVLEEALRDFPTHHLVSQLRLVLSHVYYEQKEWEKAKALLQFNLIGEAAPSSGPYRDSMYFLGKICYDQGELDSAIPYLEDAVKVHPEAVQAAEACYTLAQAYLKQAEKQSSELVENMPETVQRSIRSSVRGDRQRALTYLEQTESILADRQRALGLTEAETLMLRNAQFMLCSVLVEMEKYDQAIARLNTLAMMYQDKSETLDALVSMAYALRLNGNDTESQTTLRRTEVILNQLEKTGVITDGTNWRTIIRNQMKR